MTKKETKTVTPVDCCQCGQFLVNREDLPPNDNNVQVNCSNCGLGMVFDTTPPPVKED